MQTSGMVELEIEEFYEVEYTKGDDRWELHVASTGKVLANHRD